MSTARSLAVADDPLALAERALAAAGEEALASVTAERSLFLRFARSRPTQATEVEDATVRVAVVRDGHVGLAATTDLGDEAVADCAQAARAAAEAAARGGAGEFPGFPEPAAPRAHDGYDAATARLGAARGGAALETAFAAAAERGVEAHGLWTAGEVRTAVASASGAAATDAVTDAFMKVVCIAPGGRSGYAAHTSVATSGLDPATLAARAAAKAADAREPATLPPGEYSVVLEHHAVGELCDWLGRLAFNGLAFAEGRSALNDRLGTRVAAAAINLSDSPRHPRTLQRAIDAEGIPKAPVPLLQDGVAHRVVHDTRSGAMVGAPSTGHALEPGGWAYGAVPTNLVLAGGGCRDEGELVGKVERGVYVTRLWYTNPVRPLETVITGVTRDGTFLIEDGQITRPLEDMRLTDSVLSVFDCVEDMTGRGSVASEGRFYGPRYATAVVCPAMRTRMRFSA